MSAPVFSRPFARLLAAGLAAAGAAPAQAAPEPVAAARALLETPLDVAGDLIGAAGLLTATGVALVGDVLALVDAPAPAAARPSRAVRGTAFGLAWAGSRALETLRCEDIERLPEPSAAWLEADPFVGRLDQFLTGAGAVSLGARDVLSGPALAVLYGVGATDAAASLEQTRSEDRIAALGPEPLPTDPQADAR
jgi:hypothetical protein